VRRVRPRITIDTIRMITHQRFVTTAYAPMRDQRHCLTLYMRQMIVSVAILAQVIVLPNHSSVVSFSMTDDNDISRPFKRRIANTTEYGRTSHLTARALSEVFADIKRIGLPTASGRTTIMRERRAITSAETPHGQIIQFVNAVGKNGSNVSLPYQHPFAFLWAASNKSAPFNTLMASLLDINSNKLSVIYYADEVNCGRATADVATREILGVYWSFTEFGPFVLSHESAWFTLFTLRTETLGRLVDGMQQVTTIGLKLLVPPLTDGIVFQMRGRPSCVLTVSLAMVLQDEKAHKMSFNLKGASGTKFCICCKRYVRNDSSFLPDPTGYCLEGSTFPLDTNQLNTDESVDAMFNRLREVTELGDEPKVNRLQQNFGLKYSTFSPLADATLQIKLISVLAWDWMHVYYSSGVFSNELSEFNSRLEKEGLGGVNINTYIHMFVWPKRYANGYAVFQAAEGSDDYSPSGTASEFLSITPVIAKYIENVVIPTGKCTREAHSMMALVDVTDMLILSSHGKIADPQVLDDAIDLHLTLHATAYGKAIWKPKNHYALHLPAQLRKYGFLPAVFVQERKHRTIKRHARDRHSSKAFDRGVLEEVTAHHMFDLDVPFRGDAMIKPYTAPSKLHAMVVESGLCKHTDLVQTSNVAVINSRAVTVGDVVLYNDNGRICAGEVNFHVSVRDVGYTCVCQWPIVNRLRSHLKCRVNNDGAVIMRSSDIHESAVYSRAGVGAISSVLLPALRR
jgi:hypothetical protein